MLGRQARPRGHVQRVRPHARDGAWSLVLNSDPGIAARQALRRRPRPDMQRRALAAARRLPKNVANKEVARAPLKPRRRPAPRRAVHDRLAAGRQRRDDDPRLGRQELVGRAQARTREVARLRALSGARRSRSRSRGCAGGAVHQRVERAARATARAAPAASPPAVHDVVVAQVDRGDPQPEHERQQQPEPGAHVAPGADERHQRHRRVQRRERGAAVHRQQLEGARRQVREQLRVSVQRSS